MAQYDVLVVGAGLFGAVVAHEAAERGKRVLVVDRRDHIGGNCYTRDVEGIQVHEYGAHIFRTSDRATWDYLAQFCEFNHFVNAPVANYLGELYNLPFNMNTFSRLWGVVTPAEAKAKIAEQRVPCENPRNLEEHVLNLVGRDIYEKLVRGYTEKQWGRPCSELPPSIMRRIPLRFRFDNNYYNDPYQGIPIGGFARIFERLLEGCDVRLGVDYLVQRAELRPLADTLVYTGSIDSYFDYAEGELAWRSLRFDHQLLDEENHQGVAVMNYTDAQTPYTRSIEHKHFEFGTQPCTVVTYEYPQAWSRGIEPYYPIEDQQNRARYELYAARAHAERGVFFGGRLGEYRYYDMQDTVRSARQKATQWFGGDA